MKSLFIIDEKKKLHYNAKPIEYFIDKNGCYICVSHHFNARGYPVKHFNGKDSLMSRYIWFLNTGELLTNDVFVLHKCDNPACINFNHLFIGSNYDNVQDKVNKNRQAKHSGLSENEIYQIKINVTNTSLELSKLYGVSDTTIRRIWKEQIYKYIRVNDYKKIKSQRKERLRHSKIKNLSHSKGA
jgi:ribosomal protein S13